jgi:hypothetical protein
VLVEWAALRGRQSNRLPRRPLVWVVWTACGASLPLAMTIGPLARLLHLEGLSPRQWLLALGVALAATLWRAVLDAWRPVVASGSR